MRGFQVSHPPLPCLLIHFCSFYIHVPLRLSIRYCECPIEVRVLKVWPTTPPRANNHLLPDGIVLIIQWAPPLWSATAFPTFSPSTAPRPNPERIRPPWSSLICGTRRQWVTARTSCVSSQNVSKNLYITVISLFSGDTEYSTKIYTLSKRRLRYTVLKDLLFLVKDNVIIMTYLSHRFNGDIIRFCFDFYLTCKVKRELWFHALSVIMLYARGQ